MKALIEVEWFEGDVGKEDIAATLEREVKAFLHRQPSPFTVKSVKIGA